MASDFNQPPTKSGGGPSVLVIVLVILGVLALICCGVCGLMGYGARQFGGAVQNQINAMQQIQPAQEMALNAIRADEACQEALGDNIAAASPAIYAGIGEVNTSDAPFTFAVHGDKQQTATAQCRAKQVDAVWQVTEITVELPDGKKLKVEPLMDAAPELKFDTGDEAMPEDKAPPATPPAEAPPAETPPADATSEK
jgi:hypothetical protein